jgi:hypothetical protein
VALNRVVPPLNRGKTKAAQSFEYRRQLYAVPWVYGNVQIAGKSIEGPELPRLWLPIGP